MKRLTTLHLDNVKSIEELDLEVPPLWAIYGRNGAGKSAALSGIRIGVLGYEPALGKRLQDTRQVLPEGEEEGSVGLTFDDAFGLYRSFGSRMKTRVAPPRGESNETEANKRIRRETGVFAPSFDLAAFVALSAEKRREYLFALLPRDEAILDRARFNVALGYEGATEVVRRAVDTLWRDCVLERESPIEGLASAIEYARSHFNAADRKRQDQEEVVAAADREANEATESEIEAEPDIDLDDLQAELSAAEQRVGEMEEQRRSAEREERRQREIQHRVKVLNTKIEQKRARLESLEAQAEAEDDDGGEVANAELALEQARETIDAFDAPSTDDTRAAEKAIADGEAALDGATGERSKAHEALTAQRANLAELEDRHERMEEHERCPVCGSVDHYEAALEETTADLKEAAGTVDARAAESAEADKRAADIEAGVKRARKAAADLRGRALRYTELRQGLRDAERELERVSEKAGAWQGRRAQAIEQAGREMKALEEERDRTAGSGVEPVAAPDSEDFERLRARAHETRATIRDQNRRARQAGEAEALRKHADKQRHELARRTERAEHLKALHKNLQKLRGDVIRDMVGPVEQAANYLLQAIDRAKTFRFVFEREGRSTFDFGFEEDGRFRSFDAASTGEAAFLAVVFVAALIHAVEPAWPVLVVDRVESIDREQRRMLMVALARPEVRKHFGNIILAGCSGFPEVAGWTVTDADVLMAAPDPEPEPAAAAA